MIEIYSINRPTNDQAEVTVLGPVTDTSLLTTGEYPGLEGLTVVTKTVLTLGKPSQEEALQDKLDEIAEILTDEQAAGHTDIYPAWADKVGQAVMAGARLQYDGALYKVVQDHTVQAHYPPGIDTASLYTRINPPDIIPDWIVGSWDLGVLVRHIGKVWESMVPNNVWEPGAPGVYDNIWREVTE
ncbi:MAG: hypothetical protein ACOX63_10025 [Christensenellales bacterium]|jgi:hypothetical protein